MIDRDNNGLPPELKDATRILREPPPLNDLWRQRLLRDIDAAPRPHAGRDAGARRLTLARPTAIAAAVACLVVGGAASLAVERAFFPPSAERQVSGGESRVRFTLVAPNASHVALVGDFNGWNAGALPLQRGSDGTWEVEVPLRPGRYAYSFVVDGALARDPSAPQAPVDDFGGTNSVVMVKGS